jgi:hypothetical protein
MNNKKQNRAFEPSRAIISTLAEVELGVTRMVKTLITLVVWLLCAACNMGTVSPISTLQNNKKPVIKDPETSSEEMNVVRIVIGGDKLDTALSHAFAQYYSHSEDKERNHLFFAPDNRTQKRFADVSELHAYKHEASEMVLGDAIKETIKKANAKTIVFYLDAHGAPKTGNLCYERQETCSLSAEWFMKLLLDINEENRRHQKIERIVMISGACFSKIFADRLKLLTTQNNIETFALALVHLEKVECGFYDHTPSKIFERRIDILDKIDPRNKPPIAFEQWLSENNRFERLFIRLKSLRALVKIHNEVPTINPPCALTVLQGDDEDFNIAQLELYPYVAFHASGMMNYDPEYKSKKIDQTTKRTLQEVANLILKTESLRKRVIFVTQRSFINQTIFLPLSTRISYEGESRFIIGLKLGGSAHNVLK